MKCVEKDRTLQTAALSGVDEMRFKFPEALRRVFSYISERLSGWGCSYVFSNFSHYEGVTNI